MIRVSIVAASPLARTGLESVLVSRGVEVAASTGDIEFLTEEIFEGQSDIVLVLINSEEQWRTIIGSASWTELLSEFSVVVLVDHVPVGWPAEALSAGVRAILPSDVSPGQLVAALETVASGLVVVHPSQIDSLSQPISPASRPLAELTEPLTRREGEVLQMLASGLGNKEIASGMSISEHTVKFHVTSILGKLGAGSRTEAVAIGIRRGLILL